MRASRKAKIEFSESNFLGKPQAQTELSVYLVRRS